MGQFQVGRHRLRFRNILLLPFTMGVDYYYMILSGPCRGPMLTAKAVGLELNLKSINLLAGEQMKPEFLAINPTHVVPTAVDGDFTLWESRAIAAYFVNQYGKDDSLYPKDPKTRAQVDKLLYFDMGTLYQRYSQWAYPALFQGKALEPEKLKAFHEALGYLDSFMAGGIDMSGYKNIVPWLERCEKNIPGYELNKEGCEAWKKMAHAKLNP